MTQGHPSRCDVAVIGLGAHGSAALYHLARRGARVLGIERVEPGHDGGSSHGESRIIRMAYFEHPSYVPLLHRAWAGWRALEAASRQRVLTVTGILEAGWPGSEIVAGSLRASLEHGLPHERLSGAAINARFPAFDLPADWEGVWSPQAGALQPEQGIALHLAGARAAGAEIVTNARVRSLEPEGSGVLIVLADGETIQAGSAVVAAGAGITDLVPELKPHLTLTRQVVAWFAPLEPALTAAAAMPIFLIETEQDAVYGFPDLFGSGVKAGSHVPGRVLDCADAARQDAGPADVERILQVLRPHVPAAAGPVRQASTCIYASTRDGDFIVDRHPDAPQIVLASPCSGHGYKFAPVIGEALADMALGGAAGEGMARFGLGRLGPPQA